MIVATSLAAHAVPTATMRMPRLRLAAIVANGQNITLGPLWGSLLSDPNYIGETLHEYI